MDCNQPLKRASSDRCVADVLLGQVEHRYRVLERAITAGVGLREALFALGSRPTIAWHTAHLAEAIESTQRALLTGPGAAAGEGPDPPTPGHPIPPCASEAQWLTLRQRTLGAAKELRTRLAELDDAALGEPPLVPVLAAFRESLRTRRAFLEGHVYHVTYHLGSIATLRAEMWLEG